MQNEAGTCSKKWHKIDTQNIEPTPIPTAQKKTAGEFCSFTSGQSIENVFKSDSSTIATGNAIHKAANWYLANKHGDTRLFMPRMREKFGLTIKQVLEAFKVADASDKEVRYG